MAVRQFDTILNVETDTLFGEGIIDQIATATKAANYTILDDDGFGTIIVDTGAVTITLPTAADNTDRKLLVIHDAASGIVSVLPDGAETLDGVNAAHVIANRYDTVYVQSDGAEWLSLIGQPMNQIQDYTTVGSVGDTDQQEAGHTLTTDSFSAADAPEGLWSLDDLTDDSGNAHTLTNINATPFTGTGIFGASDSADFVSASSQCLHATGTDFDDTGSFSAGAWVMFDTTGANENILTKYDGANNAGRSWLLGHRNAGTDIQFKVMYDAVAGNVTAGVDDAIVTDGLYHHVVGVYDQANTRLQLYVDGILIVQTTDANLSARNNDANADFTIGADDGSDAGNRRDFFDGRINNAFYTKTVLSADDIKKLYATRYTRPSIFTNADFVLEAQIQEKGDTDFVHPIDWQGMEVTRDADYIYRAGGLSFDPTDKLRIVGRK